MIAHPPRAHDLAIDLAGLTHTGHVRDNNEDHFVVGRIGRYFEVMAANLPPGFLPEDPVEPGMAIAVADGIGGHPGGEVASQLAITTLVEVGLATPDWILRLDRTTIPTALRRDFERFRKTNAAIAEQAARLPRLAGMGTTLTVALSLGFDLRVMHVGDSRAYLLREGRLMALTRDHSHAEELLAQGHDAEIARRFRHVLTQSLGGTEPQPKAGHWRLAAGDRLLVCTDGLTDMVDDDAIAAELGGHPRARAACRALVQRALDAGGADNVTVAVAIYGLRRRASRLRP